MGDSKELLQGISLLGLPDNEEITNLVKKTLEQIIQIKTAIKFTSGIESIDDAVKFLIDTDAVICGPGNLPYSNGSKNTDFVFIADAEQIYAVLKNSDPKITNHIKLFDYSLRHTDHFKKMHHDAQMDNKLVLEDFTLIRDKINFIYSLCAKNKNTVSKTQNAELSYKIFQKFILTKIKEIESQSNPELQNQMIADLVNHTITLDKTLKEKHDSFFEDLGKIKQTTPATCKVLLSDCTYADLFNLNGDKQYKIMHSIDVSKLKQDFDFSNFDINGDFICVNPKKANINFPNQINGAFDLTGCKFTLNRIPNGATTVNLSHTTIKNFIDLQTINFPDTTTELVLDTAIIKNILKLLENKNDTDPEIIAYKNFIQKYPKIQFVNHGRNLILQQELENKQSALPQVKDTIQNVSVPAQVVIPEKTDDWLAPEELKEILLALYPELKSVDDLDRLIQRARNLNSKVQKETMKYNGIQVICVHKNSVHQVMENMRDINAKTPKHIMPVQKKQSVEKTEPKQAPVKKLKGIKYKKYMPASVYKQIKSACGDSMQLFISVLERISMINTNYSTTQNNIPLQYIDKDGQTHNIPNTTHKLYKAATTSITGLDNRRIVLTINPDDKIIVATAFFADHVNNIKNDKKYNDIAIPNAASGLLIDGKTPVTRDLIKSGDYIDIDAKLKELKEKDNVVVKTTAVVETKTITTTTTTVVTETVKQRRPRKRIHSGYVDVKLTANILEGAIKEIYAQLDKISKTTKIRGTKKDLRLAALEMVRRRLETEM